MTNALDARITDTLKKDKTAGIRLIFDRYYMLLVVYAGRFLHDHHRAEDLVQEFFIRLWKDNYLENISPTSLSAYLFTGIRNSSLTALNKKDSLRNTVALSEIEIPTDVFTTIDDERIEKVVYEIEKLPERTRKVVEGVMLKEQKYKEVAEEMNISVNTVKFLLKEGTKRLREKFSESAKQCLLIFFQKK